VHTDMADCTPHSSQYSASILGQTNNHSNILSYCMISTAISSNLINNCSFKLQFNHIKFYHLESFYCSLHCGRQPRSRHMQKLHLTKSGGSEAAKPWTLKSGGLEPRGLTFAILTNVAETIYEGYYMKP